MPKIIIQIIKLRYYYPFRLQEVIIDPKDVENGRIPRNIDCELTEDLTNICTPGDLVTVNGVLKALSLETSGIGHSAKDKCTSLLFIDVNSVQGNGMVTAEVNDQDANISLNKDIEFTGNELAGFKYIKEEKDVFKFEK